MVPIRQAVTSATHFIGELYPQATDIRLEEVEKFSEVWNVVVSFRTAEPTGLSFVMGQEQRLFKTVLVNADDGSPYSLKVWKQ